MKEEKNNIDNEKKEDKEDKEKIGLYLNFIINQRNDILFNYKNNDVKNIITFIDESIYLVLTKDDDIIKIYQHSEIESGSRKEQIILAIKKSDNSFILQNPMPGINILPTENTVDCLKKKLWYVINSESIDNYNIINDDYYLNENDIIKMGNIIYIVNKININNKDNNDSNVIGQNSINTNEGYNIGEINRNAEPIFNFYPSFNFEKCKFYDGKKVKLCKCDKFIEINCLKKEINDSICNNKNKKVVNISLDYKRCEKCNDIFPLSFKLGEIEEDLIDLLKLSKLNGNPEINYLILESVCHKEDKNKKQFHVIYLLDEEVINIGRECKKENDLKAIDSTNSLSKDHAKINYKNGKLLIKNSKGKSGTLVLIKNSLKIKEKKIICK